MIRFELKLLSEEENGGPADVIEKSNALARHACQHLKKLIGKRRCRKHPSSPNKLRVYAVKGGDPKAQVMAYCCPDFLKRLK